MNSETGWYKRTVTFYCEADSLQAADSILVNEIDEDPRWDSEARWTKGGEVLPVTDEELISLEGS
jgi:hypothetical protein